MTARLIDGTSSASELRDEITELVREIRDFHHVTPGLAVILVGDDPASEVYVRTKHQRALDVGMKSFEHTLPRDTTEHQLLTLIEGLNDDPAVHGILIQLPLPNHLNTARIMDALDPAKDVDGFHPENVGRLVTGVRGLMPCTPLACMMLLKEYGVELDGRRALVVGRSNVVGKPMAQLLLRESATVTIAHSHTQNLAEECRRADVLIAAVGRPGYIRGDWVKPGAVVLDVGINRVTGADGRRRLVGDVVFDEAAKVAGLITPVPGGVGPMTIAVLLRNTLVAACRQNRLKLDICDGAY